MNKPQTIAFIITYVDIFNLYIHSLYLLNGQIDTAHGNTIILMHLENEKKKYLFNFI